MDLTSEQTKQIRADVARLTDLVDHYTRQSLEGDRLTGASIERICAILISQVHRTIQLENETAQLRAMNAMHAVAMRAGSTDEMQQAFDAARDQFARARPDVYNPVAWGMMTDVKAAAPAAHVMTWLDEIVLRAAGPDGGG